MAEQMDFETALKELERLVAQMEGDQLPLDEALKTFEQGINLSRYCAKCLDAAEKQIQELSKNEDGRPLLETWGENSLESA
ncbi:MAG: exodeoxyribonuclease VII small subunit [Nitrospiraceae bacterium]|nr:exodeoxyribonuclease VII small subunit [Nitrospiraceae bacterium]